jgi:hypothetical protein
MKKLASILLLLSVTGAEAQPSYWWQQLQRKPDAKQSQEFFFVPGANVTFSYASNHVIINASGGGGGGPWDALGAAKASTNGFPWGVLYYPATGNPSGFLTANQTITLSGDATGSGATAITVTVTNLHQGLITNKVHWTNVVSLTNSQFQTVDMTIKEGDFQTNAAFAFLGIINKSATNYQSVVVTVFNTTASVVGIGAPPNTHTNGVLAYNVTNISKVLIEWHPLYQYTNMLVYPLW